LQAVTALWKRTLSGTALNSNSHSKLCLDLLNQSAWRNRAGCGTPHHRINRTEPRPKRRRRTGVPRVPGRCG
jgi:nuclear transport factor 2 (NTF2) superfamily protein